MVKVNIYGCGISGLTIAHELIEKGFNIEIYEKKSIAGGMARTFRYNNGVPTEHSWRGFGPFYKNTYDIMKRISIKESNTQRVLIDKRSLSTKTEAFNTYTIKEIKKHTTKNSLWTYYKGYVYDLTKYIKSHPGGAIILRAGGKDLEQVWKDSGYGWHMNNSHVMNHLNKYKIGKLKESFEKRTVYDNLVKIRFILLNNKESIKKVNSVDYPFLIYYFGKVMLSNKRREKYYKINLKNDLKNNISQESYDFLVKFLAGPGYGFDINTISYAHYALFLYLNFREKEKLWNVLNQPTNEGWIDPWTKLLKKKGVKFNFNQTLEKINHKNNKITYCNVNNKKIKADEHIFALDPYTLNKILLKSNLPKIQKQISNLVTINNQISFRLGFNRKIKLPNKQLGFVLLESPYNITFYLQEDSWANSIKLDKNNKIKTLISGTIIQPYANGILYNKTATSLSKEKLLNEIQHQLINDKHFNKLLVNKKKLSKNDIIFREIFTDWIEKNGRLTSTNKKWVNNSLNQEYRPTGKTEIKNMFLAGSHNKTSVDVWSMEGAVESGKDVSNFILEKYKKNKIKVFKHNIKFGIISIIDDIFYKLNLPHIIDLSFILFISYIIYKHYLTTINNQK
jgi:uncharacterized protein with NAD-binding domain and iron-sulfur cluster